LGIYAIFFVEEDFDEANLIVRGHLRSPNDSYFLEFWNKLDILKVFKRKQFKETYKHAYVHSYIIYKVTKQTKSKTNKQINQQKTDR